MKRIIISLTLGLALTLALLVLLPPDVLTGSISSGRAADGVIHVDCDAEGGGDGETWLTAYKSLQDALDRAETDNTIEQIWVAAGVYTPTNEDSANATFQLVEGVTIYGGFAGGENDEDMEDRDLENNLTILSGDLDGNDIAPNGVVTNTDNINGTNAYHVVTGSGVDSTASLDGITITAGSADGSNGDDQNGGGMFNQAGNPTLTDVTFIGNRATEYGGGMYNLSSEPNLANVDFDSNQANNGGGMMNWESNPTLTGGTFTRNQADNNGGGLYNSLSNPQITHVHFMNNRANNGDGGGLYNYPNCVPYLKNVTFSSNYAEQDGGGMMSRNSTFELTNITFIGNHANRYGGGIMNLFSNLILTNALFSGNYANENGGGMYNDASDPTLVNITVSGNYADQGGGGMYNNASDPTLVNAILWGDRDSTGVSEISGNDTITIIASNIEGSGSGIDPEFVTPIPATMAPTTDGDYHLHIGSDIIDTGDNASSAIATDLDGNPRIVDGNGDGDAVVDMGAYEFQTAPETHNITVTLAGSGHGSVSSSPPGISCPDNCNYSYPTGSTITLTAVSSANSTFTGWSVTSCAANPICKITLDADLSVMATFSPITISEYKIYLPLVMR